MIRFICAYLRCFLKYTLSKGLGCSSVVKIYKTLSLSMALGVWGEGVKVICLFAGNGIFSEPQSLPCFGLHTIIHISCV